MQLLARAEAHMHDTGERWYEAELHHLRGALSLRSGGRGQWR